MSLCYQITRVIRQNTCDPAHCITYGEQRHVLRFLTFFRAETRADFTLKTVFFSGNVENKIKSAQKYFNKSY